MFPSVSILVDIYGRFFANPNESGRLYQNYVRTPVAGWRISYLFCVSSSNLFFSHYSRAPTLPAVLQIPQIQGYITGPLPPWGIIELLEAD